MKFSQVRFFRGSRGFSLVELLIAIGLASVLILGMVTLFSGVKTTFNENDALGRLQENGRFAVNRLTTDLRLAGFRYCSSFLDKRGQPPLPAAPRVMTSTRLPGVRDDHVAANVPPAAAANPYRINPDFFVRGFECAYDGSGTCSTDPLPDYLGIPDIGTDSGDRIYGSDIINVRYWLPSGEPLVVDMADQNSNIQVASTFTDRLDLTDTVPDFLVIADCQAADIFTPSSAAAGVITHTGADNLGAPSGGAPAPFLRDYRIDDQARVFQLADVAYYLSYQDDNGTLVPTLRRIFNGQDQELVRGIERLDFTYNIGIQDNDGINQVALLTAQEIEDQSIAECGTAGCLWGRVSAINMTMLATTDSELGSVTNEAFRYSGANPASPTTAYTPPDQIPRCDDPSEAVTCGSLPANSDRLLRREFTALINVRNYNQ